MKPAHNKSSGDTVHPTLSPQLHFFFSEMNNSPTSVFLNNLILYAFRLELLSKTKNEHEEVKRYHCTMKTNKKKKEKSQRDFYLWPFGVFSHGEHLQSQSHAWLQLLGKESRGEIIWIDAEKISACLKSCPLYFARSPYHVWANMQSKNHTGRKGKRNREREGGVRGAGGGVGVQAILDSYTSFRWTKWMIIIEAEDANFKQRAKLCRDPF